MPEGCGDRFLSRYGMSDAAYSLAPSDFGEATTSHV
jgi:hypothetical protein